MNETVANNEKSIDDVKFSFKELEKEMYEQTKNLSTKEVSITCSDKYLAQYLIKAFIQGMKNKVQIKNERYEQYLKLKQEFEPLEQQVQPTPPIAPIPQVVNPTQNKPYMYPDKDGWYTVPVGWDKKYCPLGLTSTRIEAKLRGGQCSTQNADTWTLGWVQDDHPGDIVKFRIVE